MPTTTWTLSAPTGPYKNHALSMALYESAIADTVFMEYVRPEDGFGRKKGESITLTRYTNPTEPTSGRLLETERIPEYPFTMSTKSITVGEFGGGIPTTNLFEELSEFDLQTPIQKVLRNQLTLVMDTAAAAAYKATLLKYCPTGVASSTVTTNGTFGGTAASGLNMFHVEEIADLMYDTYFIPPYSGGEYIGIFRNRSLTSLQRDPAWEQWFTYTNPQAKFNDEMGKMKNIRFVRTNHATALANVGTGSVLGEGVVFGDDAVVMAEALSPELRAGMASDGGRSNVVYWYGIFEYGLIWDTANAGEVRVVHVGSL